MADAQLVAVMGRRGMGKSASVKRDMNKLKPPRFAVWDLMREYQGGTENLGDVIRAMDKPRFKVSFYPSGDEKTRSKQFEIFCRALMTRSTLDDQVTAVVEELAFVTSASWAPGAWQEVSLLGRHRGLTVFGTSQRPASIDKDFLGNATMVRCFALKYEADAKVMAKVLDVDHRQLMALQQFHHFERGEKDQIAKKLVLKLPGVKPPLEPSPKGENLRE